VYSICVDFTVGDGRTHRERRRADRRRAFSTWRNFLPTCIRYRHEFSILARALREFFADHLPRVRGMSPHTVCSYRDAVTLLLRFLAARHDRDVVKLDFKDLSPDDIIAFLHHLEVERRNAAPTRNARLAAIHAFARFAAANHPEHLELCQRILAVPFKRARARLVEYLEAREIAAILDAPDGRTTDGRRDHALLLALFNTGARVQEILDVRPSDLQLVRPFQVRLRGKGRKDRICPLWPRTVSSPLRRSSCFAIAAASR
jgi:site-specific recombinase XerD